MATQSTYSLLVVGECMMELSGNNDTYQRAFAGDTYNSAVYAKRCRPTIDVQILTAVGNDPISVAMRAQWDRDRVGDSLVMISNHAHPGIYAISTDEHGERSFTYWRSGSAATELVALLTPGIRARVAEFDMVFFSGITLAILSEEDKAEFLSWLANLKEGGTTIAFDPNYRESLWNDGAHAAHWITQAYALVDIALPGLSDHRAIFAHQRAEDVHRFLSAFDVKETVLKAESGGIYVYQKDQASMHIETSYKKPVDTTGAGDAFAGTYLAERLMDKPVNEALTRAAKVASLVIRYPGAIVDPMVYKDFVETG